MKRVSRRTLLRGAGGIAMALPFLELFATATKATAQTTVPKRFIVFFHHQGTILRHWAQPGSTETNFTLGEIMSPLDGVSASGTPWRDRCLFLYGIDNNIAPLNQSNGHNSSARTCLTANVYSSSVDANGNYIPEAQQPDVQGHANGASIDQELASRLQTTHPYRSVDVSVAGNNNRLLYAGKDDPVDSEPDPQAVFDRFFSNTLQSADELAKIRLRKLSVLDGVKDNFDTLRKRLGAEDRARLDAHAQKILDLETAIANAKQCETPILNPAAGFDYQNDEGEGARLQLDLFQMAMACDLAPVGTFVFGNGHAPVWDWVDDFSGPIVPSNYDNWHDMNHTGRNIGANGDQDEAGLVRGFKWYTEQFVELLRRLDETPEDNGSMLDNTCVLWMSEFGNGSGHNTRKLHTVLAGNVGGAQMGRCIPYATGGDYEDSPASHNQTFVSLLNAFGYDDTQFGWYDGNVATGALSGLA
jgi:hypothetical protein